MLLLGASLPYISHTLSTVVLPSRPKERLEALLVKSLAMWQLLETTYSRSMARPCIQGLTPFSIFWTIDRWFPRAKYFVRCGEDSGV